MTAARETVMQQIELTYELWMQVHPEYRSIVKRVPHVVAHDRGECKLMRVRFVRAESGERHTVRPGRGQLRLRTA
jgi:hypothetical protein